MLPQLGQVSSPKDREISWKVSYGKLVGLSTTLLPNQPSPSSSLNLNPICFTLLKLTRTIVSITSSHLSNLLTITSEIEVTVTLYLLKMIETFSVDCYIDLFEGE